jgi:PTS system nitrogen regulatory IIA component
MIRLEEQCIILELEATGKDAALREMTEAVHARCPGVDRAAMHRVLSEREQLGSTGIGNGVAIPHGKLPGMEDQMLCLGRSRQGISFDAVDNRPVHLIAMLISPQSMAEEYLQALARVSRVLKNSTTCSNILQADTSEEIVEIFNQPLE